MISTKALKILLLCVTLAAFASGLAWIYHRGAIGALVTIERQNNAAGTQSDDARGAYDRCIAAGRMWDFSPPGKCRGPEADRRK